MKLSGYRFLFVGSFLITDSVSLLVIGLFFFFFLLVLPNSVLGDCTFLGIYPFLLLVGLSISSISRLSILLVYNCS